MRLKSKLLIPVLLVCILLSSYSSAATDTFNEHTEDPHFIASRGTFTDTIDQEWRNTIGNCCANLPDSYSYYKFDKAISSFACGEFIIVELKSGYKGEINDSRIDQLYQKLEAHCEESTGLKEVPVVFMWAEDEEDIIYEYDPNAFENAKTSSGFVAAMGSVPLFANEAEWLEWSEKVHEARHIKELEQYFSSGPVISYGFKKYSGYIEVGVNIDSPEQVNDSILSEIYHIIENHYEEEGITDIPVMFVWTEMPQNDEAVVTDLTPDPYVKMLDENGNYIDVSIDDVYMDENGNFILKDSTGKDTTESNEMEDNTSSTRNAPGFTLIMLILCMMVLMSIKK
nr:hypothetical protein [uncultured Methanolobus sp.]